MPSSLPPIPPLPWQLQAQLCLGTSRLGRDPTAKRQPRQLSAAGIQHVHSVQEHYQHDDASSQVLLGPALALLHNSINLRLKLEGGPDGFSTCHSIYGDLGASPSLLDSKDLSLSEKQKIAGQD